jgi:glyoxylase-like metal-dependent hydrolase (beta-lactamase superfamily II)
MTSVELIPLLGGEICLTARFEFAPPGPLPTERTLVAQTLRLRRHWAPIPAFLLRHPTGGDVLVDTALDPSVAHDPVATLGPATGRLFPCRVNPLRPQLDRLGAAPGTILMTHLHSDHISGIGEFPDAVMLCDRREWDATFATASWLNGYVPRVAERVTNKRLLDLEAGEPHDLFGDGSIRLLSTPGHSPGHCSVLVRTAEREVLLCGDAAGSERQLYELQPPAIFADRAQTLESLRAIQAWHSEHPEGLAVPGHDPGWTEWLRSGARDRAAA